RVRAMASFLRRLSVDHRPFMQTVACEEGGPGLHPFEHPAQPSYGITSMGGQRMGINRDGGCGRILVRYEPVLGPAQELARAVTRQPDFQSGMPAAQP